VYYEFPVICSGLSDEEKQSQKGTIICNILDSVEALLRAADR
jgi:hypothetical protein